MQRARRDRRHRLLRWALIGALAGCSTHPMPVASPPAALPAAGVAVTDTVVLGSDARYAVVVPAPGDTLSALAARFLGDAGRAWEIAEFNGIERASVAQPLVLPLQQTNPLGVGPDGYQTVPVLCYHRFRDGEGSSGKMTMSAGNFALQLDWLARNGYHVIRLAQLQAFLEGSTALPRRSVAITIDDGYASVYRIALPLLRKYGFPATVFATTDFIGAADALSWPQLREATASGLVAVQAHSKTHRNLLDRVHQASASAGAAPSDARDRQLLDVEIGPPRQTIERALGTPVTEYAYPYGDADTSVLDLLALHRYTLAFTVTPGGNAFFEHPLLLHRTMIYGDLDLATFQRKLETWRSIDLS